MAKTETSTDTRRDIEEQIREIRSDIAALTELLGKFGEERIDAAKHSAATEAEDILRRAVELAGRTEAQARNTANTIERSIREKPLQSALIAFVIGILLGSLSRR